VRKELLKEGIFPARHGGATCNPTFRRLKQEDREFQASLSTNNPVSKTNKKKKN
jgi:hypothetical protein